jgi:hypothetical protein
MKYTKPQITHAENASFAIMNTGGKDPAPQIDSSLMNTNPGYSADE